MIVCSCNAFSDQQVRSALAQATHRLRMSQIYDCLGCSAQCGHCAHTIKGIMDQEANNAIPSVAAIASRTRERNNKTPQPARSFIGGVPI